jgi:hypothetical protein
MPAPISAAARILLASRAVTVRKVAEIFREYLNGDLRLGVEVTDDVVKWGDLGGASTIKRISWEIPGFTVSLDNKDGKYSRGGASSIWVTTLARDAEDCALRFRYTIRHPSGLVEVLKEYHGDIVDVVAREEGDIAVADIVTRHLADDYLSATINKKSGDEQAFIAGGW